MPKNSQCSEKQYFVNGMHCASCELLIENKLLEKENIKSVEVSQKDKSVLIEFTGEAPNSKNLNRLFKKDGYTFSDTKVNSDKKTEPIFKVTNDGEIIWNFDRMLKIVPALLIVAIIFGSFLKFSSSGLASLSVNAESSLLAFVAFGVIAGFSTCSALVGGIVLSMSKQWSDLYQTSDNLIEKLQPQLLFNLGRLLSYALIGFLLGSLGNVFQISISASAIITILVSILMIVLSLQILGVEWASKFQPKLPKVLTRNLADQRNFSGRFMPVLMGAGTVLLPCGFTITTQGIALLSGDPIRGALIMTAFALGTAPILLFIGFSSLMFNRRPHITKFFSQVAGLLIILFSLFNLNSAFNVLGLPNLSSYFLNNKEILVNQAKVGETQIINMSATAGGYEPSYFKVKVNQPVEWRITDNGASGCTNAVIAKDFFDGEIRLNPGQTSTKIFTPTKVGKFRFSCWMGMATGIIEVTN
jgi:uncharacterized protein